MTQQFRSNCPINMGTELLGDKWTMVILRDVMFVGKRHFRELSQSSEHISSAVLSDRLLRLVQNGLLIKSGDPDHKQGAIYSLTDRAIDLAPVLIELSRWSRKHLPVDPELARRSAAFDGGPEVVEQFMTGLRIEHVGGAKAL